jgi:hypothetical protein
MATSVLKANVSFKSVKLITMSTDTLQVALLMDGVVLAQHTVVLVVRLRMVPAPVLRLPPMANVEAQRVA